MQVLQDWADTLDYRQLLKTKDLQCTDQKPECSICLNATQHHNKNTTPNFQWQSHPVFFTCQLHNMMDEPYDLYGPDK